MASILIKYAIHEHFHVHAQNMPIVENVTCMAWLEKCIYIIKYFIDNY